MVGRLHGLDALRGVAAILVLCFHVIGLFGQWRVFDRAWLAVDLFFMLSGFVMARTYESAMRDKRLGSIAFFRVRYRRLWAPVAFGTMLGIAFHVFAGLPLTLVAIIAGLILVPTSGYRVFGLNAPAWSIFFELLANILHALILHRMTTRVLVAVAISSFIVLVPARIGADSIFVGHRPEFFWFGVLRVIAPYCIGIVLYRTGARWDLWPAVPPLVMVACLILIPKGIECDVLFVLLVCPLLIVTGQRGGGVQLPVILGALSFPLYAVHYPIMQIVKEMGGGPVAAVTLPIVAAILVGLAIDRRLSFNLHRNQTGVILASHK